MTVHESRETQTETTGGVQNALSYLDEHHVAIQGRRRVEDYLITHPHVLPAVPYTVSQAQLELGSDVQILVEVDRSAGPGNEYLVFILRLPQYREDNSLNEFTHDLTKRARREMEHPERRFIVMSDFVFAQ